jgi:hypothetical protein
MARIKDRPKKEVLQAAATMDDVERLVFYGENISSDAEYAVTVAMNAAGFETVVPVGGAKNWPPRKMNKTIFLGNQKEWREGLLDVILEAFRTGQANKLLREMAYIVERMDSPPDPRLAELFVAFDWPLEPKPTYAALRRRLKDAGCPTDQKQLKLLLGYLGLKAVAAPPGPRRQQ